MLEKLQNAIISKLKRRTFDDDDEAYRFLMLFATNFFVLAVHLLLLAIFLLSGRSTHSGYINLFVYLNLFSVIFYSMCFLLIHNRKYLAYGFLMSIEVCAYTMVFCVLTGIQTYGMANLILVVILQAMVPYGKGGFRFGISLASILLIIACIVSSYFIEPMLVFSDWMQGLMLSVNVFVFLTGAIAMIFIGNPMSRIIKNFNETKISELANQSLTDELTGLYNRRYARKFFEEGLSKKTSYCLAMLDIDDFKVINDTYGHNCGDEILKFLSHYITQNLRSSDIVVRWGGEEFLIILSGASLDAAYSVMEELREYLSREIIHTKQKNLTITVTIGIVPLSEDIEKSINSCDQKMYEGKRSGKNMVVM